MPRTISHVLGFMLALLLVGLSACVAAAEDPAVPSAGAGLPKALDGSSQFGRIDEHIVLKRSND